MGTVTSFIQALYLEALSVEKNTKKSIAYGSK